MNEVNKTLYIPLYGKAMVSRRGIILRDEKAEQIWEKEGFSLKGKSRSKWLAIYMAMRSAVFDRWLKEQMDTDPEAVVLHLGCGMDSRILRVGNGGRPWYDLDFPDVIQQRKKHYAAIPGYTMLPADARQDLWLDSIPAGKNAIIVMEGISMYMTLPELTDLLTAMRKHFRKISLLMDCYTEMAAKASKFKNPVNDVGVTTVYGLDDPKLLEASGLKFLAARELTPQYLIDELRGIEKWIFHKLYAGSFSQKLYRLYEFRGDRP